MPAHADADVPPVRPEPADLYEACLPDRRAAAAMIAALPVAAPSPPTWPLPAGIDTLVLGAGLCAAVLCGWNALTSRRTDRHAVLWAGFAIALLLLALDRSLDWQSWFTQAGRDVAQHQHWYDTRRLLQVMAVVALSLAAVRAWAQVRRHLAERWPRYRMAATGTVAVIWFVAVRTVSLHHVDAVLAWSVAGLRLYDALELCGLGVVIVAAARWRRPPLA